MVHKKFLLPNFFTGLNFLLGIYSILLMTEAFTTMSTHAVLGAAKPPLVLAAWMIVWCALLDKLDGFAAKLLHASSEFGAQFDSLADLTAFGIAPGFLVYFYVQWVDPDWFSTHKPLMILSGAVYMICAAMRLARYNAIDSTELKDYFHGLPSTFAGSFMAVTVLLYAKYDLMARLPKTFPVLPLLLILMGLLMVSPLYLPKLMKRKNPFFNAFQIANILVAYTCGFGMVFPAYLYTLGLTYGVVGFVYGLIRKDAIENSLSPASGEAG